MAPGEIVEDHMVHVGDLGVYCPICGESMQIGVWAGMTQKEDGKHYVTTQTDVADLWAHSFMHKEGKL